MVMLIYNVLVTIYLGYMRFGAGSVGRFLLPALAVHAVLATLFIAVCFQLLNTLNDVKKSSYGH